MSGDEPFERWLLAQGYQKPTVSSTLRMVRRAREAFIQDLTLEPYKVYLKRWLTYAASKRITDEFTRAVGRLYEPVEPEPKGSYEKPELTSEQWRTLTELVYRSEDALDVALSVLLSIVNPLQEMQDLMTRPLHIVQKRVDKKIALRLNHYRKPAQGVLNLIELVCGVGCTYDAAKIRLRRRLTAYGKQIGGFEIDFQSIERTPWAIRSQAVWR